MMDQHSYPYSAQQNIQPNNSHQSPQNQSDFSNIVLTSEEIKILNECRTNAILYRGIPLGGAMASGYYYMINKGILQKNLFGMILTGITGFFIGTVSYRGICMEKLLSLPNSTLKDRILALQKVQPQVRVDVNSSDSFFDSILPSSNTPQDSSLEPYQSDQLDSYDFRPIDAETAYAVNPPLQPVQQETYITYDELRHRNRDGYYRPNSMPSGPAPPSSSLYLPSSPTNAPLQQGPTQSSSYSQTGSYNDRPAESARSFNRMSEQRPHDDYRW